MEPVDICGHCGAKDNLQNCLHTICAVKNSTHYKRTVKNLNEFINVAMTQLAQGQKEHVEAIIPEESFKTYCFYSD